MQDQYIIIITACPNREEAKKLTSALLDANLAACVQASHIESTYRWQGNIETEKEVRLLIKTRSILFDKIANLIRNELSFVNPEILSIPVLQGKNEYLDWIYAETKC